MERRCIGHLMVDSGQLFITDPAYLATWHHGDYQEGIAPDNSYARVTTAMFAHAGFAEVEHGIVCATDGDGYYPVFVSLDDRGTLIKLEVVFQGDEEDHE